MKRSVSSWLSPNSSARRPAEMCRQTSICHIRSWAWTKPWAMNRSCAVSARDVGDAGDVADDGHRPLEPGNGERAAGLREAPGR